MVKVHHLGRQDARRVAVRAQLLQQDRPADLLSMVRRLTLLQLDPVNAAMTTEVDQEIADLAVWLKLDLQRAN